MKYITRLIALLFLLQTSCTKVESDCCLPPPSSGRIWWGASIPRFHLVNDQGMDLLNKDTQGNYNNDSIRMYNLVYGREELIQNSNHIDLPKGYAIVDNLSAKDSLHTFLMYIGNATGSRMYEAGVIQWNENERDTIALEHALENDKKYVTRLRYNGVVVWDEQTAAFNSFPYFTIVK